MSRMSLSVVCSCLMTLAVSLAGAGEVSVASLLDEMTDRAALCQFPDPPYVCKQFSSYDRAAVSTSEQWFANSDNAQYLRVEKNGEREEAVLMEADGPGAIVRFWITAPEYFNNLYFYIDGNPEPVIAGKSDEIIGGTGVVSAPLSQVTARGRNLYLPIPYAKKIKITCDCPAEQKAFYYQINYRSYPAGTDVASFSKEALAPLAEKIAEKNRALTECAPDTSDDANKIVCRNKLEADELTEPLVLTGPQRIQKFSVKLTADDPASAARSTLISIIFDGKETVYVPVGDFFGSGVGVNPYKTWYTRVQPDGEMTCFWPMPFKESAEIRLLNLGKNDVDSSIAVESVPTEWSDRTMYFHANWRQERNIKTVAGNGTVDWNYAKLAGKGVFVGDALSLVNRDQAWWGEGDEKIYVDGENFPSHFGTGTEDYYGYAWGTADFFESPFRAQPRAEGPASFGNITNLRFRDLDAIPFTTDFRFDMEVWHWAATEVDYAVATFWYGLPGAQTAEEIDAKRIDEEAAAPVRYKTPFKFALDGIRLADENRPVPGRLGTQGMASFGKDWKNNRQLWWTETKPGDRLEMAVTVEKENPKSLRVGLTAAVDYAVVQFWLDGKKLGEPVDLFHPNGVIHLEKTFENLPPLSAGEHRLDVEIVGKNEKSVGTMFGADFLTFE